MKRALIMCLLLAGCASTPAVKAVCLPLKPYTADEQKQLAAELGQLPPTSTLSQALTDYAAMRDADRACLSAKP